MKKLPRKVRGYKISDKDYVRAQKRASKSGTPLATKIEEWVTKYGKDGDPVNNFQLHYVEPMHRQI